MRAALVIAAKDLRQKLRDRSVLLMAVAAPARARVPVLAPCSPTRTPSTPRTPSSTSTGGEIARGLVDGPLAGLAEADVATLVPTASEAEARAAVEAGDVAAAIVIPAGFSTAVQAGQPAAAAGDRRAVEPARPRSPEACSSGSAARSPPSRSRSARSWPRGASPDPALAAEVAQAAVAAPAPIAVTTGETADRSASTKTFYGASMAVLFVFFAAQFGVLGLLAERRNGTLARMLAAPIAPATDPPRQGPRQPRRRRRSR